VLRVSTPDCLGLTFSFDAHLEAKVSEQADSAGKHGGSRFKPKSKQPVCFSWVAANAK
jgi:hypothetical protein